MNRDREQIAQSADICFAGNGVPGNGAHGQREEQGELDAERGQRDEESVGRDRGKEVGPMPGPGGRQLDGDSKDERHHGQDAQARLVAAAAEDQPQLGAQEAGRDMPQRPGRG